MILLHFFLDFHFTANALAVVDDTLIFIKHLMTLCGSLVILGGSIFVICQFIYRFIKRDRHELLNFDLVRLGLTRSIILGLEFIIAADVIQTSTTPDYYAVGILAAIALIRAFLNYSLNKDLTNLTQREEAEKEQIAKDRASSV